MGATHAHVHVFQCGPDPVCVQLGQSIAIGSHSFRVRPVAHHIDYFFFRGSRQFCDRTINRSFIDISDFFHRKIRLRATRRNRFPVALDKLASEPPENVIGYAGCVPDVRVLRKSTRLKTLIREFLHQTFKRHTVLQRERRQRRNCVHQTANRTSLFRHLDKQFSRLPILVQTDCNVPFVTCDLEFVRQRKPGIRHPFTRGQLDLRPERFDLLLKIDDLALKQLGPCLDSAPSLR